MGHRDIYINCLAFQITQAKKKVQSWYESYLRPLGLTPAYVYVLGALSDLGSASPSEISDLLQIERPTVTALLTRMERDGLVVRHANPRNKRAVLVGLTVTGAERAKQAYPLLIEADRALNDMLEGDFQLLKGKIEQLNDVLGEA